MKKNLGVLTDLFGEQVSQLNESDAKMASEKLEKILETRVDAKVKFQTEVIEEEAKEKYEAQLKESTDKFEGSLKDLEESVYKKAEDYKTTMQKAYDDISKELTEKKEAEMKEFKKSLTEKLDKYLKYELDRSIPQMYVEAAAKVQIFEPIVEGCKKSIEDNYMKLDEENFGLLKDAKSEIVSSREEAASLVKENMDLSNELLIYKRAAKVSEVCEGLTDAQREEASTLLESYDVDEIQERFSALRDIIIEGEEKKEDEVEEVEESNEEEDGKDSKKCDAPADTSGEVVTNEEAESEEETMSVPEKVEETLNPKTADVEAMNDDNRLIESWAQEFRSRV